MMNQKITPPAQALQRLAALCAKAEYCGADIQRKLARWQLDADPDADQTAKQHILDRLAKDGYIDEARYAHAFVRDNSATTTGDSSALLANCVCAAFPRPSSTMRWRKSRPTTRSTPSASSSSANAPA